MFVNNRFTEKGISKNKEIYGRFTCFVRSIEVFINKMLSFTLYIQTKTNKHERLHF